jgi:hypothetical protein
MRGSVRLITVLGLIALVPAAVGAAPVHRLEVALCDGAGTISIPLDGNDIPGAQQPGCCAKGCHTGPMRKRGKRAARA